LTVVVATVFVNTVRNDVLNATVFLYLVDLGNLAFPLRTAGTGVTTRHLALGDSHLL
jgi:hypothetical protein